MANDLDPEVKDILQEARYKQVAQMLIAGRGISAIAKEFGVHPRKIREIISGDELKTYLKEQADMMVSAAANTWKSAMQDRVPVALEALDKLLKKGDAEGIKIVMRSLGVDKLQEGPQQAQNIQVILPNTSNPKDIGD